MNFYEYLFNEKRPLKTERNIKINVGNLNSDWSEFRKLSLTAFRAGNSSLAFDYLDKAIHLNNDNHNLNYVKAGYYSELKDYHNAIENLKIGLYKLGSDNYAAYNQLAINFRKINNFQMSIRAFDVALELKKDFLENPKLEEVIPHKIDFVVLKVPIEHMLVNRAVSKFQIKDYEGCHEDCLTAINFNEDYSNSFFTLGILYYTLDENEKSLQLMEVALDKGHHQAKNYIDTVLKK